MLNYALSPLNAISEALLMLLLLSNMASCRVMRCAACWLIRCSFLQDFAEIMRHLCRSYAPSTCTHCAAASLSPVHLQGLRFALQQLREKGAFEDRLRVASDADPATGRSSASQAGANTQQPLTRLLAAPQVFNLAIVWESAHVSPRLQHSWRAANFIALASLAA